MPTLPPPTTLPPPARQPVKLTIPPATARSAAPKTAAKTFSISVADSQPKGQKICLYAMTGMGKSTLAAMAPDAVFIDMDGRETINPKTGEKVQSIPGISSFDDVRDALHQKNLFHDRENCTIVIDTVTKLEAVSESYIFSNYLLAKGGRATTMRAYGWDGPAHFLDIARLLLSDLDEHVRAGRNVLLLAQQSQAKISNSEGLDYLQDGPKLSHNTQYSSRMEVSEWCDHVLRIGYLDFDVRADNEKSRAGKVQQNGDMTRAIFSGGAAHYLAKQSLIGGKSLPPVISFASRTDDALWSMIFKGAIPE